MRHKTFLLFSTIKVLRFIRKVLSRIIDSLEFVIDHVIIKLKRLNSEKSQQRKPSSRRMSKMSDHNGGGDLLDPEVG